MPKSTDLCMKCVLSVFFYSSLVALTWPALRSLGARTDAKLAGGAVIFNFFRIYSPIFALCFVKVIYFCEEELNRMFSLLSFSNICFLTFIIINNKTLQFHIQSSDSSYTYTPFSNLRTQLYLPFLMVISPCRWPFKYVPDS